MWTVEVPTEQTVEWRERESKRVLRLSSETSTTLRGCPGPVPPVTVLPHVASQKAKSTPVSPTPFT